MEQQLIGRPLTELAVAFDGLVQEAGVASILFAALARSTARKEA